MDSPGIGDDSFPLDQPGRIASWRVVRTAASGGTKPNAVEAPLELARKFAPLRTSGLALFDKITPADLARRARHAELGIVTLGELLNEWAGHDLMRTVQAERALMQPFIQGCPPWHSYFVDHVAKQV